MNNVKRIYIKALLNGFHVEADDHDYHENEYAFSTWDEVLNFLAANTPTVPPKKDSPTVAEVNF